MKRKHWIAGLAFVVVCLIGLTAHVVVGQPDPAPRIHYRFCRPSHRCLVW